MPEANRSHQCEEGTSPPFANKDQNNSTNEDDPECNEQPWVPARHSRFLARSQHAETLFEPRIGFHKVSSAARRREAAIWIVTESGFLSIVRHRQDTDLVLVRARDHESLVAFCDRAGMPEAEIVELNDADYRFRVACPDDVLVGFLAGEVRAIDYDNFKSRVWQTRGSTWHGALLEVWRTLRRLQTAGDHDPG